MPAYPSLVEGNGLENREGVKAAGVRILQQAPYCAVMSLRHIPRGEIK